MRAKLRMTGRQHAALRSHLFPGDGCEAVALALCGRLSGGSTAVMMVHKILTVPYEACRERTPFRVTWDTSLIEPLLVEAAQKNMGILKIHSHSGGYPQFSDVDDTSDLSLFPSVYAWIDDGLPHMSAVMLPTGKVFARVVGREGRFNAVDTVSVAGDDIHFWHSDATQSAAESGSDIKNRQFFGEATYARIRKLSGAVVGCSGTGSPLVEQLTRLGIGELALVDHDVVKHKNLNRILNSTFQDAEDENLKVLVLSRAIKAMGLGTLVTAVNENLISREVLRQLAECDVLFGCMDTAEGRYFLNRLAVFYSIPYFDIGIRIDADGTGGVSYACGSVHYLQPDGSSLLGRGMISPDTIAAEGMARRDPAEYARQRRQGYIRNVEVERPAVVTINMQFAAMAANEFIARIHPYRRIANRMCAIRSFDLRENDNVDQEDGAPCALFAPYAGRGDMELFLDDVSPELQA